MDPNVILNRVLRLARLDTSVFDEVRDDQNETVPAVIIAAISAFLAGLGSFLWWKVVWGSDLPDGEVFTAPIEDSVNGTVTFSFPAKNAAGIQLTFKDGEVVSARADSGDAYLQETLQTPGARRLGEIGIGTNFNITDPIGQILFDEKIGGTVHLALGSAYPASGGKNQSPLHWDLIVDLRNGGELLGDGQVILKGGQFVHET